MKMGSAGEQRGPRGPLEARKGREDPQTPGSARALRWS